MDALRPARFVELGTHSGNSYAAFCQAVRHLGLPTACAAVDTWADDAWANDAWTGDPQAGHGGEEVYRTFAAHHDPRYGAFSRLMRMTFDEAVSEFDDGSIDLLHIDGRHSYDAVRHDFETWRPKMSRRGVVLFHGIAERRGDAGVWRLWEDVSAAHPSFAFLHAHGLGVLGLGEDVPDAVRALFAVQAEGGEALDTVRRLFERLGEGAVQAEAVQELEERLRHLDTEAADRARALADAEDRLRRQDLELAVQKRTTDELRDLLAQREYQIGSLLSSTSWRLSAPVRQCGRVYQEVNRAYRRCVHRMTLVPHSDIKPADGGGYESTGGDPAFLLQSSRGRLPSRWCVISYKVLRASAPLTPLLYADGGQGFDERTAIRLPVDTIGEVNQLALLPPKTLALRFDPATRPMSFEIADFTIREIGRTHLLLDYARRNPRRLLAHLVRHGWQATKQQVAQDLLPGDRAADYETWVRLYDTLDPEELAAIRADAARLARRPLISVVMPVYNTPEAYLREALDSVLAQLYPDWELCIADDASTAPHIAPLLAEYQARDRRIKVVRRAANGHISAASNSALELATGEFVALMDHDDRLTPHALYMVAVELNRHPDADILYSDEDKIDARGRRHDPHFKSDFNLDLLHGQNMVNHLGVFRRSLIERIGGFREGFEGSQDYDLTLRAVEATTPARIRHIPAILYHWRVFAESAAFSTVDLPRATAAAHRALTEHFQRRGVQASVETSPSTHRFTRIRYALPDPLPRVSLIVPTRDKVGLLKGCVDGLLQRTDYPDLEIIIVDNNSEEAKTFAYFDTLKDEPRVRILRYEAPFNYSSINNFAVAQATGSVIGLINNDIEVIGADWLKEMVSHALRPEVGAVGAKLYYADGTVQHAGVVTGICGVAGHGHKGLARDAHGYFSRAQLTQNLSCVTAACLIMRRAVFEEVDGLDEANLAVAFNDVDFCLRIRDRGYLVVWTPFAELYHLESASRGPDTAPDKVQRFMSEVNYMRRRWGDRLAQDPYYNPNLSLDAEDFGLAFPPRVLKPWLDKEST
ncbi:glycosyltransferase [Azospirillum rugosum]|uniref:GT2 family glycosyltransferase/histone H3/H4 n=1 Tax=Azospirillum rugosum TaxID=416170 RepID=A0ABS4SPA5_9PROT|nr:glycosyltransferase [Azospirillum rugosum]MBP2294389.1 GT2 family glycosyltransferase/histone H3/H4 [Azospirillum rugosum]MDQ0527724.1 GT2 family glycosyltransferase/histone H3/H4 [Azospirillum rugosum]